MVSEAEGRAIARRAEKRAREDGSSSSTTHAYGSRVLHRGLSGRDVLTLQRYVTSLGYPTPRTGDFTRRTKEYMIR